jgi:formylglycine-generating enzyme required for sulfatase activity
MEVDMLQSVFAPGLLVFLLGGAMAQVTPDSDENEANRLVLIEGGTFQMGDVFGDGAENERPIHAVTLSSFYLARHEVTVGEFRAFVEATGYKTSAEGPDDPEARAKVAEKFSSPDLTEEERRALHHEYLKYSGAGYWDAEQRRWLGYNAATNWTNPGIEQTGDDPVLAISPIDAMRYCNWLSEREGQPVAYNPETGVILDENGAPTTDVTNVRGYRLPTEAEWEYAAREGGREVRFGNGKNIARSTEINFRGDDGDYDYLDSSGYLKKTTPVGSFPPNALGLYDMSGNAWEWVSDNYAKYGNDPLKNPYTLSNEGHILRGGRWGGDAFEARVFHRSSWPIYDRCNNSGFRIAKSK